MRRRRHAAVLIGALLVLGGMPGPASGHHRDGHKVQDVSGTSDPRVVGKHVFIPAEFRLKSDGTVRFSNDDHVPVDGVDPVGPPHSWTLLAHGCDPRADEPCAFDSGVLQAGRSAQVQLNGLAPGSYTFICKVGQAAGSLPLPPHATEDGRGGWTGMVGTVKVTGS